MDIVLILIHTLVLQEYWVLAESRIPLKPAIGGVRIIALESAVFLFCRFFLFQKDSLFMSQG